jgi:hypothetical protein
MNHLIPIALSSQLDVTGEERLHAAPYTPTIRPTFVAPPPPEYFVWQSSDTNSVGARVLRTGYGSFDTVTNTVTYHDYVDQAVMYPTTGTPGYNVGGDLVTSVYYDNVGIAQGVYAYKWDGTSLVQQDHWQWSAVVMYQEYFSLVKWDANTVICTVNHSTPSEIWLHALDYDGTAFTEVASLNTGLTNNDQIIAKYGNYLIMLQTEGFGNKLRAYSFDGTTFALLTTYGGTISERFGVSPKIMEVQDNFIFLSNGQVFTYDGTAFTLVTQEYESGVIPFSSKFAVSSTAFFNQVSGVMRAYSWDGSDLVRLADPAGVGFVQGAGWMRIQNNRLWLAYNPDYPTNANGIYDINAGVLTKLSNLLPPSPNGNTIFYSTNPIDPLTVTA